MDEMAAVPPLSGPAVAQKTLCLASASPTRAKLLEDVGIPFTREPAAIDEAEIRSTLRASGASPAGAAEALAEAKAVDVSVRRPGSLVLGADQILECGGAWFQKPAGRDEARDQLRALRGRSHRLVSSACVVRSGERLWGHTATAELVMRPFSDAFLEGYLETVGDAVLESVGAYQLERMGAQLFSRVSGDHFAILGLPLLPLLEFLREHRLVAR